MKEQERMDFLIKKGWRYEPETGNCYTTRGKVSFVLNRAGYQQIVLSSLGKVYFVYAHRFAWYCSYGKLPTQTIDHINRIKSDNRIENLRDVSHTVNVRNRACKGYGVVKTKYVTKYRAQIWQDGKYIFLGTYLTPEEATKKYQEYKKNTEK